MNLPSKRIRLLVISSLVLIAVVVIVLSMLRGNRKAPFIIPNREGSDTLRTFSGPITSGSTASTDPCGLLDKKEIEEMMGVSLAEPQSGYVENPLGERFCSFADPEDADQELFRISIVFNDSIDPALLNDGFSVLRMFEGRKVSPQLIQAVDKVGDDAFWGGTGNELWNGLHILVNDVYLQVDVYGGDNELDYRVARNMASAALERLFAP